MLTEKVPQCVICRKQILRKAPLIRRILDSISCKIIARNADVELIIRPVVDHTPFSNQRIIYMCSKHVRKLVKLINEMEV